MQTRQCCTLRTSFHSRSRTDDGPSDGSSSSLSSDDDASPFAVRCVAIPPRALACATLLFRPSYMSSGTTPGGHTAASSSFSLFLLRTPARELSTNWIRRRGVVSARPAPSSPACMTYICTHTHTHTHTRMHCCEQTRLHVRILRNYSHTYT